MLTAKVRMEAVHCLNRFASTELGQVTKYDPDQNRNWHRQPIDPQSTERAILSPLLPGNMGHYTGKLGVHIFLPAFSSKWAGKSHRVNVEVDPTVWTNFRPFLGKHICWL
jgi:hypothetical protein